VGRGDSVGRCRGRRSQSDDDDADGADDADDADDAEVMPDSCRLPKSIVSGSS
jgi:hypothetical protein